MRVALPDINVLIALAWPSHVHHRIAREWFARASKTGWAACPFTQAGFIRVSSNPRIIADAVQPRDAVALLSELARIGRYEFWPADLDLTVSTEAPLALLMGHRQVTDAYLLGLAIHHEGTLVTLDRGVPDLLPAASPHRTAIHVLGGGG